MSEQHLDVSQLNPANLNPALFYELVSKRTFLVHHISPPSSISTPFYCVTKHESVLRKNPDLKLHRGSDKSGQVLGVVKIGARFDTIGVGDPDAVLEEGNRVGRIVWERLQRTKKWTYKSYEFEYERGVGRGERQTYTWRRTKNHFGFLRELELRVGGPEQREGEVLAVFVGTDTRNIKRGRYFIKRSRDGDGEEGMAEAKRWELMVLLTSLAIIESAARRSR
jgi:hypothetical protein